MAQITYWGFDNGTAEDTAVNGGLLNGTLQNGASIAPGGTTLDLDGSNQYVEVPADPQLQLNAGTLITEFSANTVHTGTIFSRDSLNNDQGGHFYLRVNANGSVEVRHQTATTTTSQSTAANFYAAGDDIRVVFSWDNGTGGTFTVENLTQGTSFSEPVAGSVTWDQVGTSEPITIGANQNQSSDNTADNLQDFFNGSVDYVSLYDTPETYISSGVGGDGVVTGTSGADLINAAYAGDPDGDMVDANDGLFGAIGDADTIRAGNGNDTVIAGSANDSVNAGMNDDSVEGGTGDDVLYGDQVTSGDGEAVSPLSLDIANVRAGSQTGLPDAAVEGDSVIYDNVGTLDDGTPVAARVTLVSRSTTDLTVDLTGFAGAEIIVNRTNDPLMEGETATFQVDFIDTVTGDPLVLTGRATWGDIDEAVGGAEAITISDQQFYGYEVATTNQLNLTDTDGNYTATGASGGTNLDPSDQTAWFTGLFDSQSGIEFTTTTRGANSGFTLNGDAIASADTVLFPHGNDTLEGEAGADTLFGNGGDDSLVGGTGDDSAYGGTGDDTLWGDQAGAGGPFPDGNDLLGGGDGNDQIRGEGGDDTLAGDAGVDTLFGGDGRDSLSGGDDADVLNGGAGADTLDGDAGNDQLNSNDDATGGAAGASDATIGDVVNGGTGNDVIFANGSDTVDGGEDPDGTDIDTLNLVDVVNVQYRNDLGNNVAGPTENGIVTFLDGSTLEFFNIETLNTTGPDGYVEGTSGDDLIDASYAGDPEGDRIDNGDAILPGEVGDDDIVLGGGGNDTIIASAGNDEIYGDSNDVAVDPNTIGLTGNDQISGGAGDDAIFGQGGDDTIILENGFGNDTITGGETGETDGDLLDGSTLTQDVTVVYSANEQGTFSNGSQTAGFSEIERLNTGSGDDFVNGNASTVSLVVDSGAGDDSLRGSSADDALNAGADNDTVVARGGNDSVDAGSGDDSVLAGGGTDLVFGRDGADILNGGSGADTVAGGSGADEITGGSGNDILHGGEPAGVVFNETGTDGLANAGTINDFPTDALTFEIRLTGDAATAGATPLVSYAAPGSNNEFLVFTQGGNINVFLNNTAIDTGVPQSALFDGTEHSFAVTWDSATGELLTYIDGAQTSSDTFQQGAPLAQGGTLVFGQEQDSVGGGFSTAQIFDGQIHEARLWDDVRTAEEVAEYEGTGLGEELANPNLVSDWLPAADRSGLDDVAGTHDAPITGDARVVDAAGDGNDTLDGGTGNDTMYGDGGDDTFVLQDGHGTDTITGSETGETNGDVVDATAMTADSTLTFSGDEAGTLTHASGTAGFEEIERFELGSGDDVIDASLDTLGTNVSSGAGNDVFDGGSGADTLSGGADADTFNIDSFGEGFGDVIDGGTGGTDADTLDLTGSLSPGGSYTVTSTVDSDGNGQDGTITYFDSLGAVEGTLTFTNIETIVPCFTTGSMIATNMGRKPVEMLRVGDLVKTRDSGLQPIRWIGRKVVSRQDLVDTPSLRPIRIARGSLGLNSPNRDMMVSPQHRMLVSNVRTQLHFGEDEVLVAAKHLQCLDGVEEVVSDEIVYYHVMFDAHEVVFSDGAWSESFQPAQRVIDGMGEAVRTELETLFPEMFCAEGGVSYPAARPTLSGYEAPLALVA